jgi:chromosome segregation ATPase
VDLLNTDLLKPEYVAGALLLLLVLWLSARRIRWQKETREDPRDSKIRQLLADVKLANRQLDEVREQLDSRQAEFEEAVATMHELRAALAKRDAEVEELRTGLRQETARIRELRQEIADQAQERLREQVIRKQAETELEVAQAGNEAVIDEFTRLQQQQEAEAQAKRSLSVTDTHVDVSINEMLTEK